MTTQTKLPQALFPDYPREPKLVDHDGKLLPGWDLGLSNLFQRLQSNYSNEGLLLPPLDITQINSIQATYVPFIGVPLPTNPPVPDISGALIFDVTNRVVKVFIITYDGASPPNVLTAAWVVL